MGQDDIVTMVKTAITSAQRSSHTLGHMLFSGNSGYGKTTLAHIIANEMQVNIKIVT
ncbi:AAA family ATPase [Patescibacteria group bacterium]|nr:AAA family ATPase [Patescibacteria group bacterium]